MRINRNILVAVLGAGLMLGGTAAASAQSFDASHPRRAEVNERLDRQDMRIHRAERQGRITPHQAAYLHHKDHTIRMQERRDAKMHNGHITRMQQARLNREENRVSHQIYRDGR